MGAEAADMITDPAVRQADGTRASRYTSLDYLEVRGITTLRITKLHIRFSNDTTHTAGIKRVQDDKGVHTFKHAFLQQVTTGNNL